VLPTHGNFTVCGGAALSFHQRDSPPFAPLCRSAARRTAGRLNRRPVRLPAAEPAQARQLLRKLLVGRLVWTSRVDAHGVAYELCRPGLL